MEPAVEVVCWDYLWKKYCALRLSFSGKIGRWDMFRSAAGVMCWVSVDITCGEFLRNQVLRLFVRIRSWDYLLRSTCEHVCEDYVSRLFIENISWIKLWRLSGSINSWYDQLRFTSEINCGRYSFLWRLCLGIKCWDYLLSSAVDIICEINCWYYPWGAALHIIYWNQRLRISVKIKRETYLSESPVETKLC